MQTLPAGCSKAEPKFFAPLQTPFPGARDNQNLISWRWSLPLPINPVWWGSMHAISSYHGNRPTNTPTYTHKPTDRTDYNALRRSFTRAQCNKYAKLTTTIYSNNTQCSHCDLNTVFNDSARLWELLYSMHCPKLAGRN